MKTQVQNQFGIVLKTFGANGALLVKLAKDAPDEIDLKEPVFIVIDGIQVPFFFSTYEIKGNKAVVVFVNMETEDLAAELVRQTIWCPPSTLTKFDAEPSKLIGCTVVDLEKGVLGLVSDFYEYPANHCIEIKYDDRLVLIPLIDPIVISIDYKKQIITTCIPDGLLDC